MNGPRAILAGLVLILGASPLYADPLRADQQQATSDQQPATSNQQPATAPVVRDIHVAGAREQSESAIVEAARVEVGRPLPVPPDRVDDLAARIVRFYRDEGYTFANVTASF